MRNQGVGDNCYNVTRYFIVWCTFNIVRYDDWIRQLIIVLDV